MFFFRLIALLLGVEMVSVAPVFILMHRDFREILFLEICPEKRPSWMWFPIAGVSVLIAISWYVEFTTHIALSWIITFYLSLGLVKFFLLIFRYDQFRGVLLKLAQRERFFQWGFGSLIYFLGIFFLILGIFSLNMVN